MPGQIRQQVEDVSRSGAVVASLYSYRSGIAARAPSESVPVVSSGSDVRAPGEVIPFDIPSHVASSRPFRLSRRTQPQASSRTTVPAGTALSEERCGNIVPVVSPAPSTESALVRYHGSGCRVICATIIFRGPGAALSRPDRRPNSCFSQSSPPRGTQCGGAGPLRTSAARCRTHTYAVRARRP